MPNVPEIGVPGEGQAGPGDLPAGTDVTRPGTQISVGAIFPTETELTPIGGTVSVTGTFPRPDPIPLTQNQRQENALRYRRAVRARTEARRAAGSGGSTVPMVNPFAGPPPSLTSGMGLQSASDYIGSTLQANLSDVSTLNLPPTEQEDQWWETGLDVVGSILQPVASQFLQQGINYLAEQAFGRGDQRTAQRLQQAAMLPAPQQQTIGWPSFGPTQEEVVQTGRELREWGRDNPFVSAGREIVQGVFPELGWAEAAWNIYQGFTGGGQEVANVPTAQPGGAPVPGGYYGAGVSCIPPGGATIAQRPSMGMRLPSRVDVPTIDRSGNVRFTSFKNMGRPLLWSGDLAASKRVRKVAAKARRAKGR